MALPANISIKLIYPKNKKDPLIMKTHSDTVMIAFKAASLLYPGDLYLDSNRSWFEEELKKIFEENEVVPYDAKIEIPEGCKISFDFVIVFLLTFDRFSLIQCDDCKKSYDYNQISTRYWEDIKDPKFRTGGREFVCPEGHVVFKISTWRS